MPPPDFVPSIQPDQTILSSHRSDGTGTAPPRETADPGPPPPAEGTPRPARDGVRTRNRKHQEEHSLKAKFIWSVADLIRDSFKRGKYLDVILPLTVLRRLDSVLEPTKERVLRVCEEHRERKPGAAELDALLRRASGYAFYNTSPFTFGRLLADEERLAPNLKAYIGGFSPNMREVLEKFDFRNTIDRLQQAGLLAMVMKRFMETDLHPDRVPNLGMGYIFEELIRRFNEALNENPGEHFTPREVVYLMVDLLLAGDAERIAAPGTACTICDPCCGTGGMLTEGKERILEINSEAHVQLFGQEVNPETYAVCKSDLFVKSENGEDAENVRFGSTLSRDQFRGVRFDYLIANPPYGKDWKRDHTAVTAEAARGKAGRFPAGTPRISDGQLLFLQHMLSHMQTPEQGGSRVAIVMNGSPLFTGGAGSGESEIRRWILENDWLDAIIGLPEQLFYNTGIATYVWVLTNRKRPERKGRVQLIDATSFWEPMRRSLGDKRREISDAQIAGITRLYEAFEEGPHSRVFPVAHFGYRRVQVERPLRLNFQAGEERLARLERERAFMALAPERREEVLAALRTLAGRVFAEREGFVRALRGALRAAGLRLAAALERAALAALSERDEGAEVCRDGAGRAEPDPELRDWEDVPLGERVEDFFEREVAPHAPGAWINPDYRDERDGGVGRVGYEIHFGRHFRAYVPPRPLERIEAEIRALEAEILGMLQEMAE